jgi:hypothetical protein
MRERPDEARARQVLETDSSIALTYIDVDGRVDYAISRDGIEIGCLEVTRCTDAELKAAEAVYYERDEFPAPTLRHSWLLFTDGHPHYRRMSPRLVGALRELERHDVDRYEASRRWRLHPDPKLAAALATFAEAHVESAEPVDHPDDGRFLYFMVGRDGMSDGPEGAVAEISQWISDPGRNHDRAKLRTWRSSAGVPTAVERHLFVWVDGHSTYRLVRPLKRDSLPASAHELPEPITNLWVVDEDTGRGWHFDVATSCWAPVRAGLDGDAPGGATASA